MFCQKCGKEAIGGAKFCSGCGAMINEQAAPNKGLRRGAWILWGLQFTALLFFVVMANLTPSYGGSEGEEDFKLVKYVLYVIGAVLLLIAFLLRWAFRKWIRSVVLRDFLTIIIPGALCVALGIYGLIISQTNADSVSLYVLVGIAGISLVFMRPSSAFR
ncbi:MAG: zinc ribbon domain-containing protein [Dehalococcoidia bacterium]|nr:zinc ribbon domain-containing protein [Dehalococcoidia bacterium]